MTTDPYCCWSEVIFLPNNTFRSFAYIHVGCLYTHDTPNSIPKTSFQVHNMLSFHEWLQDTVWKYLHCLHICYSIYSYRWSMSCLFWTKTLSETWRKKLSMLQHQQSYYLLKKPLLSWRIWMKSKMKMLLMSNNMICRHFFWTENRIVIFYEV